MKEKGKFLKANRILQAWEKTSIANKIIALCTILTALVTLAACFLQFRQLELMSAQLTQMAKQTEAAAIAADAARQATSVSQQALAESRNSGENAAAQMERIIRQASVAADAAKISANAAVAATDKHANANKLNLESVRGRVAITNIRLQEPVVVGRRISVVVETENKGKSVVLQRMATGVKRWSQLPDGPMPVAWPPPNWSEAEPGIQGAALITDPEPVTEEFLKQIENGQRTAVFFGRIEYETMNQTHSTEFCAQLIRMDTTRLPATGATATARIDPRHGLYQCSKWHSVR